LFPEDDKEDGESSPDWMGRSGVVVEEKEECVYDEL
jgi:hypothetical protein